MSAQWVQLKEKPTVRPMPPWLNFATLPLRVLLIYWMSCLHHGTLWIVSLNTLFFGAITSQEKKKNSAVNQKALVTDRDGLNEMSHPPFS
jgi:hypothetical protein